MFSSLSFSCPSEIVKRSQEMERVPWSLLVAQPRLTPLINRLGKILSQQIDLLVGALQTGTVLSTFRTVRWVVPGPREALAGDSSRAPLAVIRLMVAAMPAVSALQFSAPPAMELGGQLTSTSLVPVAPRALSDWVHAVDIRLWRSDSAILWPVLGKARALWYGLVRLCRIPMRWVSFPDEAVDQVARAGDRVATRGVCVCWNVSGHNQPEPPRCVLCRAHGSPMSAQKTVVLVSTCLPRGLLVENLSCRLEVRPTHHLVAFLVTASWRKPVRCKRKVSLLVLWKGEELTARSI